MWSQLSAAILISLLHGLIPSHWLPLVAIGRNQHWSRAQILRLTLMAAIAHALSTLIIGLIVALAGQYMSEKLEWFTHTIPAAILVILGIWFIYRHYTHHHFHLEPEVTKGKKFMWPLLLAMFFSPCMEIEGYFFSLSLSGWKWVFVLGAIYFLLTVLSMYFWVMLAYTGAQKINAHKWEHNSGIITGIVLIVSGLLFFLG